MQPHLPAGARAARPRSVPVFVLCGGLGTRLRGHEERPKAVIEVAGRPFLAYVLRLLRLQGFRQVVLLLGHGAEDVRSAFSGAGIEYRTEATPLGTGGALAAARDGFAGVNLVLNGDSYAEAVYPDLLREHARHARRSGQAVTLLAVWAEDAADYGGLALDQDRRVTAFLEKGRGGPGWINAGVYVAGGRFLRGLPAGPSSLERDHLPLLAAQGLLRALPARCFFRDIGTPERLAAAREEFRAIATRIEAEGRGDPAKKVRTSR
jgi:D-glycero-alpha-D-manno-heptose 1-phosphate guanylyltransferase